MSRIPAWFIELAEQPATALLLDVAVKATLLVLLAMLFLRLNPRGSAALRHRVWCLVFCGLVLLPALCYMLPGLAVPILPPRPQETPQVAAARPLAPVNDLNLAADSAAPPADRRAVDGIDLPADKMRAEAMMETIAKDPRPASESITVAHDFAATPAAPARGESDESDIAPLPNPSSIWLVGAALALLPLIVGLVRSALLRAKARSIQDITWVALRDQLCTRLGLKRAAQLLEVDASIIPLSCGVMRPAVVLPHAARRWNERLRRFVLLHELSHIKRHDVVFQLIARLACALYWFHPLVWYAMHRLRVERELACDDSVLAAGERPSDYAEQLLEVARRLQPVRLHAAVAMAQSNKLEHRVGLLFSRARSHLPLSTWTSRLLLACAAAVVITVSVIRPSARATDEDEPTAKEEKQPNNKGTDVPSKQVEDRKAKEITGNVVDPDGKPVTGARVAVVRFDNELHGRTINTELLSETTTDRGGRFSAPAPTKDERFGTPEHFLVSPVYVVVTAPGYGLAWDHLGSKGAGQEFELKLAPDDTPIEGRVLDLEGRPIAGAQVAVRSITPSAQNIQDWISRARNNSAQPPDVSYYYSATPKAGAPVIAYFPSQGSLDLAHSAVFRTTSTDAAGRFRLTGLGADRMVHLELSGPGIAKTWVNAVTHEMESVPYPQHDRRYRLARCFGARFDMTVEPELRIGGIVRDSSTSQPLAGVDVRLSQYGEGFVSTVTDADGRYELTGLSRPTDPDDKIRVRLVPSPDQPYFRTEINIAPGNALDPIVRDVELKRAIWIRGQITDEKSDKPVRGMVAYYPFLSNDAAKDYANFDPGAMGMGDYFHYATQDDGSFRVPGLPGRGIVTFLADDDSRYPRAEGADAIGGLRRQNSSEPQKVYYLFTADLVNAVREINPPPGVDEFGCEFRLKPYAPHKVRLLDSAGKPVVGVTAEGLMRMPIRGLAPFGSPKLDNVPQSGAIVDVLGLADEQPRYVMFQHRERRLAAIARLTTADFPNDQPKDIVLQPAVAISGRLVDQNGKPEAVSTVFAGPNLNAEDNGRGFDHLRHSLGKTADDDGRFRIELLPPGVKYSVSAYSRAGERSEVSNVGPLKPGAQLELGDITLSPPEKAARADFPRPVPTPARDSSSSAVQSAAKDVEVTQDSKQPSPMPKPAEDKKAASKAIVRGTVVDSDGKPVAGARVAVVRVQREPITNARKTEILAEIATSEDGRFEAPYPAESPDSRFYLFATAAGYGLTWDNAQSARAGKECLLKLAPDDTPIEGRVLDLEGQPVAGVQVTTRYITASVDNIDQWIKTARENSAATVGNRSMGRSQAQLVRFPAQGALELDHPKLMITATTNADGRFRLAGLGSKRLARLELSGGGIAKAWINAVTHPMESVPYRESDPRFRVPNCFGARFDVVMEPGLRITGTVRDPSTGQPLRDVEMRFQLLGAREEAGSFISTATDVSGHFQLEGIPKPNRVIPLLAIPSTDQPYFRTHLGLASDSLDAQVHDIELKRAIWIRGRIVDELTGKPVKGRIAYYPFLTNEAAKEYANFRPELRGLDGPASATREDGSFRIPGLAGRGILTVVADDKGLYPLADGADAIGGLRPKGSTEPAVVYFFVTADSVNAVREINPPVGVEEFEYEIRLKALTPHKIRLLDPNGEPLGGLTVEGLTRRPFPGQVPPGRGFGVSVAHPTAIVDVYGLIEDQPRHVKFVHPERRLAAIARLTVESFEGDQPKDISLNSAATITGRIVDQAGAPVSGASAIANLVVANREDVTNGVIERWSHSWLAKTGGDGRFQLDLLSPGVEYLFQANNAATRETATMQIGPLKPGEQVDLGDVKPTHSSRAKGKSSLRASSASPGDQPSSKSESKGSNTITQTEKAPPKATAPAQNTEKGSQTEPRNQTTDIKESAKTVRGRIVGPDGHPVNGAHVAAIARRMVIERGGELNPDGVVLGEATADEQGRYQLSIAGASSKTHRYASVIARADNSAVVWQRLDLDASEVDASFNLKPAETITGRLVDIEGQPAAGVRLKIRSIVPTILGFTYPTGGIGFSDSTSLPAAWPQPVETDQQGRFSLLGIPASHGVLLATDGNDRFAPQELALNTGMSQEHGQRDGTYRPQVVKNAKPGDDVVLTLAPSQIFTGQVTYEDTGEAAPFAHLTVWASQQEYGSMVLVAGRADAQGRYRINPHPGIRFGVKAYAPKGAPYLTRQIDRIPWESGARTKEVNIKLPRGVLMRGQVLQEGSGKPVPDASVQYHPESNNNPNDKDDIVTGWQAIEVSDEQGRFEIVVLPGPGRLLVHASGGEFVLKETSSIELARGSPGGRRYYTHGMKRIEPAPNGESLDLTIHLQAGGKAVGELVDEQGRSTTQTLMISRLHISPLSPFWRGRPIELNSGHFELSGLGPDKEYPVHFLQPTRRIGATVMLKSGAEQTRVVLEPCGDATMRFVDSGGKPVVDYNPRVDMVVTPGPLVYDLDAMKAGALAADSDFIANVDRQNHWAPQKTDADGRFKLMALIPGTTYRVVTHRNEQFTIAKEFQAKARETIDLGDIIVERSEK